MPHIWFLGLALQCYCSCGITFHSLVIATSFLKFIQHCAQNIVLQVPRAAREMEDDRVEQHENPFREEMPIPPISAIEETDGEWHCSCLA